MRAPRFRLVWLMVAVAIACIDFAAIRALFGLRASSAGVLLLVGALPMANVLMVGILIAEQRPRSRPFLLGFEVFGAIALALYIYLATPSSGDADGPIVSYVRFVTDSLNAVIRPYQPVVRAAIGLLVGVTVIVGPQLVFALIGGFLSYRLKITVTRR